jgi:hypothetical protein
MALNLDFNEFAKQLESSIGQIRQDEDEAYEAFQKALILFMNDAKDINKVIKRIVDAKSTFLVGVPRSEMDQIVSAPQCPDNYTVYATDGSQIDVDRNQSVPHYLLNISKIRLSYGDDYGADIDSECVLNVSASNMVLQDGTNEKPINSPLLAIMRSVEEMRVLTELAEKSDRQDQTVALSDGTLIMWTLANKDLEDWVVTALLDEKYLKYMDRLKKLHDEKKTITASYISMPGSSDVVNILRLLMCPYDPVNCNQHCPVEREKPCAKLKSVTDRRLFNALLEEGQRSAVFESTSSILSRYGEHKICFFYVKVGDEIGRVEFPRWIAEDEESIDKLHAIILNQSKKGRGYPVSLSEAHEAAVVTYRETELIRDFMRNELIRHGIEYKQSAKSMSKYRREL